MEEDIGELLELIHPGESKVIDGLENLVLTWKFLTVSAPNPKNVRIMYRLLKLRDLDSPKASLCIVHGFAEHSGRMINLAIFFALQGFEVHMVDLRSYGHSGGARAGHTLLEFQDDIQQMLKQVNPNLPCFLWGHSMGGLLVTTVALNNPQLNFSGVVISAPLYKSSSAEVSQVKELVMTNIHDAVEEMVYNSYIAPSCLSKDDLYVRSVINDKKMMPLFGPGLGNSLLQHMKWVMINSRKLIHPVIFYHGEADALTYLKATEEVYNKCSSSDKTLRRLKGVYHEPHHDLERKEFMIDALNWINAHIGSKNFGNVTGFKIGLPGFPKKSNTWKYGFIGFVVIYLIIAWRVKIRLSPLKLMSLFRYLSKLLWPLALILG